MSKPQVQFEKVKDKRGMPIRGLWRRGDVLAIYSLPSAEAAALPIARELAN